ncbi:hypothetical protein CISG_07538 [Coccidioides immitis RMSCC 3703]|uniref:Uncharacterized protein n=1 Tax=Coccidioides immitis RMSCC 3703 TaxID=454286 RepID=A0A0J8R448_COCIT|nr:hypothetical protein CISG_07538 [Coccidioides immitis RMSCC 3703]
MSHPGVKSCLIINPDPVEFPSCFTDFKGGISRRARIKFSMFSSTDSM